MPGVSGELSDIPFMIAVVLARDQRFFLARKLFIK